MIMRLYFKTALYLLIIGGVCRALSGCAAQPDVVNKTPEQLGITVSILPQKYFVERVGGNRVNVNVMVGSGDNPHTYEPKPEQMRALSTAAAYFSIGVDFEDAWLERIVAAKPDMLLVDTIADIERMPLTAHHHEEPEHAETAEHEGLDPHVWTSPELVKQQARTIYAALAQLDPAHAAEYKTNLEAFVADIETLQAEIRATLAGLDNRQFMVFHPSWGYFARDFGLEQIPVEIGGQEPSAAELAELISTAREAHIKVIFAQPELSQRTAETIAREIDGRVLLISPLAPDWLQNMRNVAAAFADVLRE